MDKRKTLIFMVLVIFLAGMLLSPASASHTVKLGKYKAVMSDKQYKQLKKNHKNHVCSGINVKTVNTYTTKKPIYKTVTKTKWKHKNVLISKTYYSNGGYDHDYYSTYKKYVNNGWKYEGSKSTSKDYNDGSSIVKNYNKYKKKVKVKTKVKTGYKKVKKHYILRIHDYDFSGEILKPVGNEYHVIKEGKVRM